MQIQAVTPPKPMFLVRAELDGDDVFVEAIPVVAVGVPVQQHKCASPRVLTLENSDIGWHEANKEVWPTDVGTHQIEQACWAEDMVGIIECCQRRLLAWKKSRKKEVQEK